MTASSLEVTPGYGARVATMTKGGVHHQAVVAYKERIRKTVVPSVVISAYSDGKLVCGELSFQDVVRFPGDTVSLERVQILLRGDTSVPADLDLILYSAALSVQPVINGNLQMTDAEALAVLGIVRISASDFVQFGSNRIATKDCQGLLLQCISGETGIRAVLIARGALTAKAVDSLALHLTFERS